MYANQDMVLGSYYLTMYKDGGKGEGRIFADYNEAYHAYIHGDIELHSFIYVPKPDKWDTEWVSKTEEIPFPQRENGRFERLRTTLGRLIYNYEIPMPREMGYYNDVVDKKVLGTIVERGFRRMGISNAANLLDGIKSLGFKYSTKAGITVGVEDIKVPGAKKVIMDEAEKQVMVVEDLFAQGLVSEEERYQKVIDIWNKATDDVTKSLMNSLDKFNPIYMMANSGARGNVQQMRQLAGTRGLMADPSGRIIDLPIKANFREGLNVLEFFISTHGARKGLADTALRTADSGYLTRRLVDVAQEVIVREDDCGDSLGVWVEEIKDIESLAERIEGRAAVRDIVDPETGVLLVKGGEFITTEQAEIVGKAMMKLPPEERKVNIRSVLTCRSRYGICRKCYGRNLATGDIVDVGESVGIIAAQSIGEPGTQLTMRTFHTGGVAGDDITQGLPRVEELFEARKPKGQGMIAKYDGIVNIAEDKTRKIQILDENNNLQEEYQVPYGSRLRVNNGSKVEAGDVLTEGSVNPHDLLEVKGIQGVQMYLLQEVQRVYRLQGVDINDKHIEVMVRQMLKKVKIENAGDTYLLPGALVDSFEFEAVNKEMEEKGLEPATAKPVLLGITKASLVTDSFLSAASFQETTRVLTDAAIKGKVDPLLGLKENVIIGKLIPAGTGLSRYSDIVLKDRRKMQAEEDAITIEAEDHDGDEWLEIISDQFRETPGENIDTTDL